MTAQGIRELKEKLSKAKVGLAQAKAHAIRAKREYNIEAEKPKDYEAKAFALLKKGKDGSMNPEEAERLALEALSKKEHYEKDASDKKKVYDDLQANADRFEGEVRNLQKVIETWERKARTLKSRKDLADSRVAIREQISSIDSSSTVSMLKRMEEQVDKTEALAEAHEDLAKVDKTVDDKINEALAQPSSAKDALEAMKQKL